MKSVLFAAKHKSFVPAKPGQVQWDVAGTYQWVCPPGVKSICCVMIAAGQNCGGSQGFWQGGYGGGVRYQNDIPVVPGQTYTIVVGAPSRTLPTLRSSAFGIVAGAYNDGTAFTDKIKGGWGGGQGNGTNNGYGGYAGTYVSGPSAPSTGQERCGDGTTLLGTKGSIGTTTLAGNFGGGGGGRGAIGGKGAVRIIWGEGRAYPNINVANVAA